MLERNNTSHLRKSVVDGLILTVTWMQAHATKTHLPKCIFYLLRYVNNKPQEGSADLYILMERSVGKCVRSLFDAKSAFSQVILDNVFLQLSFLWCALCTLGPYHLKNNIVILKVLYSRSLGDILMCCYLVLFVPRRCLSKRTEKKRHSAFSSFSLSPLHTQAATTSLPLRLLSPSLSPSVWRQWELNEMTFL